MGRILTIANLKKCQIIVIDWCCMYKGDVETTDNILHCPVAHKLWSMAFSIFEVQRVMPKDVVEL